MKNKQLSKSKITGIAILLLWLGYIACLTVKMQVDHLPSITSVFVNLFNDISSIEYWNDIIATIKRVYVGMTIAVSIAVPLAILTSQYKIIEAFVVVVIEILRPIPNVAWVPISIMLFSGMNGSIYFITFMGAFFSIFTNAYFGMKMIPREYAFMSKGLNISKFDYIFEVVWPYSLSYVFTGVHLGMGGAWLAVIMAEMINGRNGIGYLVWRNYTLINYAGVVSGMLVIGGLGALSSLGVRLLHRKIVFWESENK